MDEATQRLIERTRQRREMLNEKLGKTPDPAPRKRTVPLGENNTNNILDDDDSPKRHCRREYESSIKADTPAITGVRSRLAKLKDIRSEWSDTSDADTSIPVAAPRKSISSPPSERRHPVEPEPMTTGNNRGGRFAKLASNINSWEDDMSHPTIVSKVEEKKPKWQPPKPVSCETEHKGYAPEPPKIKLNVPPSPKKTQAPPPPPITSSFNRSSPLRNSKTNIENAITKSSPVKQSPAPKLPSVSSSPMRTPQHYRTPSNDIPVNAKGLNETPPSEQTDDEPTAKPVSERFAKWEKKTDGTPKSKVDDPTQTPVSARMATWQQKAANPTPVLSSTKKPFSKQVSSPSIQPKPSPTKPDIATDNLTVHKTTTDDPASLPVSSRMASWQQKAAKPKSENEPTAFPVLARMSAWEHMSSTNQVSYIKKVNPAPAAPPAKPAQPIALGSVLTSSSKLTQKGAESPKFKRGAESPKHKTLTPSKSFVESIQERASQINSPKSAETSVPTNTKTSLSPAKASCAMKSVHQRLMEQTHNSDKSSDMVDKIRQERMAELGAIQNRWKNGILSDKPAELTPAEQGIPAPPPPPAPTSCNKPNTSVGPNQSNINKMSSKDAIKARARADSDVEMEECEVVNDKLVSSEVIPETNNTDIKTDITGTDIMSDSDNIKHQNDVVPESKNIVSPQHSDVTSDMDVKSDSDATVVSSSDKGKDFDQKLAAMGFEVPGPESPVATYYFKKDKKADDKNPTSLPPRPPSPSSVKSKPPPAPAPPKIGHASRPNSIFGIISKNKQPEVAAPQLTRPKFDDSFDSDDDQLTKNRKQPPQCETTDTDPMTESDDEVLEESSAPESEFAAPTMRKPVTEYFEDDGDDDVSLSAFVPASVRRQSVLPHEEANRRSITSETSVDSFDEGPTSNNYNKLIRQQSNMAVGGCSMTSIDSVDSQEEMYLDETCDDEDKADIDDLLDEAMDSDSEQPVAAPRRRHDPRSTQEPTSPLIYSVSMYRSKRYNDHPSPKMKIVRNSDYTDMSVEEEEVEMPHPPVPTSRKSLKERIQELQELVQQEQSIIMQTSNALNQCCSGNSAFRGSSEQVECNRLLLISCQKRQVYMMEIQRLKDTGRLEESNGGPKGSLTISDIRLPLKKEFVTKIGTAQDTTTYYFVLLIHNGPQLIFTQMLSTHDSMMRGSLDFPNLIKINGIDGNFNLNLEIFGMSVSKEQLSKDKKKKTPKKSKSGLPLQSPGGPLAVRTTSFSLITSFNINMKCLDKSSFELQRLPYLSPLHGTIYMRLKCLMEANVEERGFLTMFEDVSGLGAWHRRWIVLSSNKLSYWKYPDDEGRKEPIGFIDLKRCITEKIGLIPRDICARPNTFELVTVRQPRRGEQDTLVTKTYNTMTTHKVMLSADTKEERIVWCNKVNRALVNIRTWHSDAMRPIKAR